MDVHPEQWRGTFRFEHVLRDKTRSCYFPGLIRRLNLPLRLAGGGVAGVVCEVRVMMIITRKIGQLGNRLLLSAHLIAAAREYEVPLLNPALDEYAHYFSSTRGSLWCEFPATSEPRLLASPWKRSLLYRGVYLAARTMSHLGMTRFPARVVRIGHDGYFDLASESFKKMVRSSRPLLLSGWLFRSQSLLQKHAEAVRDYFQIIPEHQQNIDQVIQQARQDGDKLVGIHIRHGDYAKWRNGKYFYTIDQYRQAMHRIAHQLGPRRVSFFVCSNVKLGKEDFSGLKVHFGTGQQLEDMYAFAKTDWLVGPPSTYTGWASFYGDVPLTYMHHKDQAFDFTEPVPTWRAA